MDTAAGGGAILNNGMGGLKPGNESEEPLALRLCPFMYGRGFSPPLTSEFVECDVRSSLAGGGERGVLPREREGVDLLARIVGYAPRFDGPIPVGAMDVRSGDISAVPGLETGNSPRARGLTVVPPRPFIVVVPVSIGRIGVVMIASGFSRIELLSVEEELLWLRLWECDSAHFPISPPGLGNGRWWIDAVRYSIGSFPGS